MERSRSEADIDETLTQSFPASDPPSWTLGEEPAALRIGGATMAVAKAEAIWTGTLKEGAGTMSARAAFRRAPIPTARASRATPGGPTQELIGAAHGGCFSMFYAAHLTTESSRPVRIQRRQPFTPRPARRSRGSSSPPRPRSQGSTRRPSRRRSRPRSAAAPYRRRLPRCPRSQSARGSCRSPARWPSAQDPLAYSVGNRRRPPADYPLRPRRGSAMVSPRHRNFHRTRDATVKSCPQWNVPRRATAAIASRTVIS